MNLRRKQQLWYILTDLISSELVWLCFLAFRWVVYEGRMEMLEDVLIPAFDFYLPLIIYPIVCLFVYYLSGYYLRPLQKPSGGSSCALSSRRLSSRCSSSLSSLLMI